MHPKRLQFIAAITILLISFTSAHKTWIKLSYEFNKLEIIEKFCVNKEDISLQCEGKCHLKTQLKKADESQPFSDNKVVEEYSFVFFFAEIQKEKIKDKEWLANHSTAYLNSYFFLHSNNLFRPPRA